MSNGSGRQCRTPLRAFPARTLSMIVLAWIIFMPAVYASASTEGTRLTILHVNDTHSFLLPFDHNGDGTLRGGAARLATLVNRVRGESPNTLLLHGGDAVVGSGDKYRIYWNQPDSGYRGLLEMPVMRMIGFDAMVLGNHEFDYGKRWLEKLISIADFPILSANIVHQDIPDVSGRNGKLVARPYTFFQFGGRKVVVIGLTTADYMKSSQVQVLNPVETLEGILSTVRQQAHLVVVLSHQGLKADRKMAGALRGIDVIISAHCHTETPTPQVEGKTILVEAGEYGVSAGRLDLVIDDTGVASAEYRLIPITQDIPPEPSIDRFIREALVVGEIEGGPLEWSNSSQSPLGSLITDSMRWVTGADLALCTSGTFKGRIDSGKVSASEFFDLFWPYRSRTLPPERDLGEEQLVHLVASTRGSKPFWATVGDKSKLETIVVLQLSGDELLKTLQQSEAQKGTDAYLQVSGLAGIGKGDFRPESAIDPKRTYSVAVNLSLALGEGEYEPLWKSESFTMSRVEVFEAVLRYLEKTRNQM